MTVKNWFLNKNYNSNEIYAIESSEPQIIKETEKAYQLKFSTEFGNIIGWFPKSVCIDAEPVKAVDNAEIKVGDTIQTPDGKKVKVISVDGKFLTGENKKCYHSDFVKLVK